MSVNKQKIKFLKDMLDSSDFYPFLCAYSDNNVDKTIDNLSKLINYVLTTDEDLSSKSREEILMKSLTFKKQGQFLIYSTNSYLDNHIRLFGLSPDLKRHKTNVDLLKLDHQISFLAASKSTFFPLYGSIKTAIEEGFTQPKSLYSSILKQPSTDKQPILVGETETTYYRSILERRLKNVPQEFQRTGSAIANKVLKEIIGRDITLYFLPTDQELADDELYEKISPLKLRSINIPSRYSLIMTCAKQRGLQDDTKLSIDTGDLYTRPERKQRRYSSLVYCNFEPITVDENFKYSNDELTGDVSYDIDDLYGRMAKEDTREKLSELSMDEKLRKIKNSYDINLVYRNGEYHIANGRHRVLFLLHYYLSNYKDCKTEVLSKILKESTTFLAYVERTIEDDEINRILLYLEKKHPKIWFMKTNILNNKFDIIVLLKGKAYHLRSKEDLIKYTNYIEKDIFMNEYYFGNNSNLELIPSDIIIAKLASIYGEGILTMDLIDIIITLIRDPISINGEKIDGKNMNYYSLYLAYTNMIHNAEVARYQKVPFTIVSDSEEKLRQYEKNRKTR